MPKPTSNSKKAPKKKTTNWVKRRDHRKGASERGIKKPAHDPAHDDVARRALAALQSDSSDSEGEDSNTVDQTPMYQVCMMWREAANSHKKDVEAMEKEAHAAKARERAATTMKDHSVYLLKIAERSSIRQREYFMAEIGKLKAELDGLKPICPICQDEDGVATWVAECGHRVCCNKCVNDVHRCNGRCPMCRGVMNVSILRRLQG